MTVSRQVLPAFLWAASFFLSLGAIVIQTPELTRLLAVLCGACACSLIVCRGDPAAQRSVTAPWLCFAVLLFWILVVASCTWSVAPGVSMIYTGIFSIMPATFLALMTSPSKDRGSLPDILLITIACLAGLLSVWALMQVFVFPQYLVNGQVRHPFANPNAFAGLLVLGLLLTIGLWLHEKRASITSVYLCIIVLSGCALSAIASQAATLTGISGAVLIVTMCHRQITRRHCLGLILAIAAIIVAGLVMAHMPDKTDIVTRLGHLAQGKAGSWHNRIDIWSATLDLIARHPFLGTGYKTFFLTYPSVRLSSDTFSGGFVAHSDPLQIWAETGIVGIVLFYLIGIMVTVRFIRWLTCTDRRDTVTISLFAASLAFIVHTHVDFLLYTMPTMMAFSVVLAALVLRTGADASGSTQPFMFLRRITPPYQGVILVIPALMLFYFFAVIMVSEHLSTRATLLIKQERVEEFAQAVNTANQIGMGLNARPYVMAATVPLSILKDRYPLIPPQEQLALFRQTDLLLDKALSMNSRSAPAYYHRGDLARFVDRSVLPPSYPDARESFTQALVINPLHLPSRQALAAIVRDNGEETAALDILDQGLFWPYPGVDAIPYFDETRTLALRLGRQDIADRAVQAQKIHENRAARAARQALALKSLREDSLFLP